MKAKRLREIVLLVLEHGAMRGDVNLAQRKATVAFHATGKRLVNYRAIAVVENLQFHAHRATAAHFLARADDRAAGRGGVVGVEGRAGRKRAASVSSEPREIGHACSGRSFSDRGRGERETGNDDSSELTHGDYSQPILRPRFCSSSHASSGA